MNFADKVKKVRATLLISQKQLADELGVTNITVSRWETGERKPSFLAKSKFEQFCKSKNINIGENGND